MKEQCCGNCQFARWSELTPTGRIAKDAWARCLVVPIVSNRPSCVHIGVHRMCVDIDDGKHCACYQERIGKPEQWDGHPVASYQEGAGDGN